MHILIYQREFHKERERGGRKREHIYTHLIEQIRKKILTGENLNLKIS